MRSRKEILIDIVSVNGNLVFLEKEISLYPWDSEIELLEIKGVDLIKTIRKSLNGEMSFEELIKWANLIECRDDISFKSELYQEIIFELANPEINGDVKKERLQEVILEIEKEASQNKSTL